VSKFSRRSGFGLGARRGGTVTVIEQHVSRNYARRARTSFFVVGAIVALLAATVASHYLHPILGGLLGIVTGAVVGFMVAVLVFIWPVLRVFWYWAAEIALGLAVVYGWTGLMQATSLPLSLLIVALAVGVPAALPPVRRFIIALAWCVVVRHRLRVCFSEFIITNRYGSLPLILAARPTPAGERVWIWLRPGLALKDLEPQIEKIAVTCWAHEAQVTLAGRRATLVRIDIARRDPLAQKVTSPLPGVVQQAWAALNRRNGTDGMPVNAPISPGMPPVGLDLPDVPEADIDEADTSTRGRKQPRNRRNPDDSGDDYGPNNADWA
jgi:hypothetical protein